jgi:hypothetical protein
MAGPETGLTPNVDEIVQSGLADAGLGASTATTTTGMAPKPINPQDPQDPQGGGGGFNLQVSQPEWAAPPSQADMGQVDVRRGNYDTGMVPTAQFQFPFAALANRQIANQQRKAKLEKDLADFDLYANIGKAADPYVRSHGQLARADMDRFVEEVAQAYGGERKDAIRAIATDPVLKARWRDRAAKWEEMGQASQYLFKDATDLLLKVEMGEQTTVDEETLQAANDLVNGLNQFGSDGIPDVEKQVELGRRYERMISRNQYFEKYLRPSLAATQQTLQARGKFNQANGALILTETEKKGWDGLIEQEARRMSAMGMGSKEEMKQYLEGRLPKSEVVSTDFKMMDTGGSGGAAANDGKAWYSSPSEDLIQAVWTPDPLEAGEGSADKAFRLPFGQVVGGRNENMGPRKFMSLEGSPVEIRPEAVLYFASGKYKGQYFVEGRSTTEQTISTDSTGGSKNKVVTSDKTSPLLRVPLTGSNISAMRQYLPDFNWEGAFGSVTQKQVPSSEIDALLEKYK